MSSVVFYRYQFQNIQVTKARLTKALALCRKSFRENNLPMDLLPEDLCDIGDKDLDGAGLYVEVRPWREAVNGEWRDTQIAVFDTDEDAEGPLSIAEWTILRAIASLLPANACIYEYTEGDEHKENEYRFSNGAIVEWGHLSVMVPKTMTPFNLSPTLSIEMINQAFDSVIEAFPVLSSTREEWLREYRILTDAIHSCITNRHLMASIQEEYARGEEHI